MSDPRTRLVTGTYDAIADEFVESQRRIADDARREWTDALVARLADGSRVLELGCGAGVHETAFLSTRFVVTGVDISAEQIARARVNVPEATFVQAALTELELAPSSFDAVASFSAFNHVPRDLLADVFTRIHQWLVPGGRFLATLGAGDTPGWTGEWLGTTAFFSGFAPEVNRHLLVEAGFELELDDVSEIREPGGNARFHRVLARR